MKRTASDLWRENVSIQMVKLKLTQAKLGKKIGKTQKTISEYAHNIPPTYIGIKMMVTALQFSDEQILNIFK